MRVFKSLEEAIRHGYEVVDRIEEGYLVRIKTPAGWAMAFAMERP
jgi:hypothetical protein